MPYRKSKSWGDVKPPPGSAINWGDPINQGLISCWLFNEGGGGFVYDIAHNNIGTLTGGPLWMPGLFAEAVLMSGSGQFINCANNPTVQISGNFSVCMSVKLTAQPLNLTSVVAIAKDANTGGRAFGVDYFRHDTVDADAGLRFYINGASPAANIIVEGKTSSLTTGIWYRIAATYRTTGDLALYRDAQLLASGTGASTSIVSATADLTIGVREFTGAEGYWPGMVDNVRFYGRTLSRVEVSRLFNQPFAGIIPPRRRIISHISAAAPVETFGFYRRRVG